jgi:hypothetical protein
MRMAEFLGSEILNLSVLKLLERKKWNGNMRMAEFLGSEFPKSVHTETFGNGRIGKTVLLLHIPLSQL